MMKTNAIKAVLAVLLVGSASGVQAQTTDWRRLSRDGPFEVAVDTTSFDGPRTARTARTALVPLQTDTSYDHMILNVRIDCEARTISAVDGQVVNADGDVLGGGPIPPQTKGLSEEDGTALLARAVCDGLGLTDRAFPSAKAFAAWVSAQPSE